MSSLSIAPITVVGVLLAVAASASPASAEQPSPGTLVWPPMGTTITVERTVSGSYGSAGGTFGSAAGPVAWRLERSEWRGLPVVAAASGDGNTPLFEPETGALIAVLDAARKPLWTYEPPLRWEWPLEVGKAWTSNVRMTEERFASRPVVQLQTEFRVEALEDVTVPAGTFRAFRVTSRNQLGMVSQLWVVPSLGLFAAFAVKGIEERPASALLGAGRREWVLVARKPPPP
jgi:hypothetical protein